MSESKTFPRDVFLYLLSIITLVTIAVAFGILLYQYVDLQYPDLLTEGYSWSKTGILSSVRNSMAVLIVVFPVFVWVSWFLRKDIAKHSEKRDLKIRRWLLYLTLFAASLVIIGDLVALLLNFLNGELSIRFALKVITVLFIASSVFAHYFSELRDKPFSWMGIFDKALVVLVGVTVVAGFWIAGSPAQQRAVRFDEQRVSDLSTIQYQVIDYWQRKKSLPQSTSDLTNNISGFVVPKDPELMTDYGYKVSGSLSFELCATFVTSKSEGSLGKDRAVPAPYYYGVDSSNWAHGQGLTCFERTIDPDLYPPLDGMVKPAPIQ
ncbi:MAG: DUF5671 domain-containing protein [bacterium]|nr:DUF5671 domain-containing protein [bacterium]